MKIEHINIGAFGQFTDFDSGPNPLGNLVVVLGPNEAGKSTLFHFLTTMLYGFRPASRENNPYLPWGGLDASGDIRVRLDGGDCAEVDRQLRSQPGGKMTAEGITTELRNRALPWVEHVPAVVFSQVFAVTLADLAGLDAETWARIQDRLLGAMGASDLRPSRTVAHDLEQEAGALWRPHKRGNQRVRELREDIRTLRARRREAVEADRGLRHIVGDLERTRTALAAAREERERERVAVERVQTLAPIRDQLRRIATLREEGGDRDRLSELPASPRVRLEELDAITADVTAQAHRLSTEAIEPRAAASSADEGVRRILDRTEDVRALLARGARATADRAQSASTALDLAETELQLEQHGAAILEVPWQEVPRGALATVSIPELRSAARAARIAEDDRRIIELAADQTPQTVSSRPGLWPGLVAALLGVTLFAAGWAFANTLLLAAGAAVTSIGITLIIQAQSGARRDPQSTMNPGVEEAAGREAQARDHVRTLTRDLPLSEAVYEDAGGTLAADVERLQSLVRDHERRRVKLSESEERTTRFDQDAALLASALHQDPGLGSDALVRLLDTELRRAERLMGAVTPAERELSRLQRDQERLAGDIARAGAQRSDLVRRLTALGEGDLERGLVTAESALQAHLRADQLEAELERAHANIEDVRQRILSAEEAGEAWTLSDDDLAHRRTTIERLGEEIEAAAAQAEALDHEMRHMSGLDTVDSVDGELEALTETEKQLVRERDRRWVMAHLVREADRRFRDEHQPDLVRRASDYLKHLTGDRYDRIVVDEVTDGDIFHVSGPGLTKPVALAPPISTGTLEQAYLSLRLAIVDHLDQGGERLPLFLDEAFVNWDAERRNRGLEVLGSIARRRQVFVFTCHPDVAAELKDVGAEVLELDPRT